jgi:hypothetical protein
MVTEKKLSSAFGHPVGALAKAYEWAVLATVVGQRQRTIGKCGEFSRFFWQLFWLAL